MDKGKMEQISQVAPAFKARRQQMKNGIAAGYTVLNTTIFYLRYKALGHLPYGGCPKRLFFAVTRWRKKKRLLFLSEQYYCSSFILAKHSLQ